LIVDGKQYDVESACRIYDAAMALLEDEEKTGAANFEKLFPRLLHACRKAKEVERG
jgi:hypothetical protein